MRDMRKGICALCDHDEVFVALPQDKIAENAMRTLSVIDLEIPKKPVFGLKLAGEPVAAGKLAAYVCHACGFTQWFTMDAHLIPKKHVQMISESQGRSGPYR
jgi:hypothetical protein